MKLQTIADLMHIGESSSYTNLSIMQINDFQKTSRTSNHRKNYLRLSNYMAHSVDLLVNEVFRTNANLNAVVHFW